MKCILSYRVARHLLASGFHIADLDTSHKFTGQIVFIFEETPELLAELAKMTRK